VVAAAVDADVYSVDQFSHFGSNNLFFYDSQSEKKLETASPKALYTWFSTIGAKNG
jgi:hypothetical protein